MSARRKQPSVVDPRMMKALSHPIRQQVLQILNREVASPNQIAQEIGESLGTVSYHVKTLVDLGAIELVRTKPVRGALEHFYRATMRAEIDADHFSQLPQSARQQLFDRNLQTIWDHVVDAANDGGFEDPKEQATWTALELDNDGYQAMLELAEETLRRAKEIEAESAKRAAMEEEGETRSTEFVLMHFRRAG
jgi:DNA-binding transcriptional ArsR family regulator